MRYTSTRDKSVSVTFEHAICTGYAPGGGLFVPESLPKVTREQLQEWSNLGFCELAEVILALFVTDVSTEDISKICHAAFDDFPNPAIPIYPLNESLFVSELWHGPTYCFKDLGMRVVVGLISLFAVQKQQPTALVVSTSGDTGPAAVRSVADVQNPWLSILVHYPAGQISDFQRKQLTTVESSQVVVASFEGGGDDMDIPIKRMLASPPEGCLWTGVNSYNIGRPIMQMVHYFWTYFRVAEQKKIDIGDPDSLINIVLPTGAMGNIAGGYMAKKMGLPLGRLQSGCNANDITARVMKTGAFHKSEKMLKTLSDAINIQIPYNFERLLYYLTDEDDKQVALWMADVDSRQKLDLPQDWLQKMKSEFDARSATDEEMCTVLQKVYKEHDYLIDPHTAVALVAAEKLGHSLGKGENAKDVTAVLSTASPCKFEESVTIATDKETWQMYKDSKDFPEEARKIEMRPEKNLVEYKATLPTLSENQTAWEATARDLLTKLRSASS